MKKIFVSSLVLMLTLTISGMALAQQSHVPTATATLRDTKGTVVGTATFTEETEAGVHVVVKLNANLKAPGAHGIHIHDIGTCSPDFEAAGAHHNPIGWRHGKHSGDLPNLIIKADNTTDYDVWSTAFTLSKGGLSVFDFNGSSLVIHSHEDDMTTGLDGGSGERIACGVITGMSGVDASGTFTNTTGMETSGPSAAGTVTSTGSLTGTQGTRVTGTVTRTGTLTSTAGVTDTTGAPTTLPVTGAETDAGLLLTIMALVGAVLLAGAYLLRRNASQAR